MTSLMLVLFATLRVWISPGTLTLAPGEEQRIEVQVERDGQRVTPDSVRFEVLPPRLGHVEKGVFYAGTPGVGVLRAIVRVGREEAVGHAALQIGRRVHRLRVDIVPREVTLEPSASLPFQLRVLEPDGRESPDARLEVTVVPPWLGTWDPEKQVFQAGPFAGRGMLVAVARTPDGRTGIARARVRIHAPGARPRLRFQVEPRALELKPGERRRLQVRVPGVPTENLEVFLYPDPPELGTVRSGTEFVAGRDTLRGNLWVAVRTPDGRSGILAVPVAVGLPLPRPRILPARIHVRPRGEAVPVRLSWGRRPPRFLKGTLKRPRWRVVPRDLARVQGRGLEIRVRARRPGVGLLVAEVKGHPVAAAPLFAVPEVPLVAEPDTVKVGQTFEVKPADGTQGLEGWRVVAVPRRRAQAVGPGRFKALEPGEVWILAETQGKGGAVRVRIVP